jgi:hypothetical protein
MGILNDRHQPPARVSVQLRPGVDDALEVGLDCSGMCVKCTGFCIAA